MSLEEIQRKSADSFKRKVKVKIQAKEYTLNYLLKLKRKHSKMENLNYPEMKLQNHLKDPDITVPEAKTCTGTGQDLQSMKRIWRVAVQLHP